jgi:hypothetical protein
MGQVYSSAKEVLIWLGEAKDDSDFVFECIEEEAKGKKIEIDGFELNSYFKLMGRPWFRRVWVVQEAVLPPRDPIIGCGKKWIPWSTFKPVLPIAEAVESRASSESRARALIASARCYRGRRGCGVLLASSSIAVT